MKSWQRRRYEIGEVLIFAPGVKEEVAAAILVPFRVVGLRVFVHVSAVGLGRSTVVAIVGHSPSPYSECPLPAFSFATC